MISFYKSKEGRIEEVSGLVPGCWVEVLEPRDQDLAFLTRDLGIVDEFIREACDDEETSHIDHDDDTGQILVVVDCPFEETDDGSGRVQYDTHPLSFIFLPEQDHFVTVSLRPNDIVGALTHAASMGIETHLRVNLLLRVLLKVTQRYLADLRSINRQIRRSENTLRRTMDNDELISMLGLEKSLVYFSTSLQGLEATVNRIGTGRTIPLYDDDRELLDDVLIEVRQAVEMCVTCTQILNSVTDTFSNVMSNNLNKTMRTLTVLTLILSIPTGVFGFYGMNVAGLPFAGSWVCSVVLSVAVAALAVVALRVLRLLK